MYRLKLVKGSTYWGKVKASKDSPFVNVKEKEKADELVATGFFCLVDVMEDNLLEKAAKDVEKVNEDLMDVFEEVDEEESETVSVFTELQKMTKIELIAYAEKSGIDIRGRKTNDDIRSKIIEDLARADDIRAEFRKK